MRTDHLNLNFPGMEMVQKAVEAEDYPAARIRYAEYIRAHPEPERYFSVL